MAPSARPTTKTGISMKKYKGLIILFIAVTAAQAIFGSLLFFSIPAWEHKGIFGDMFGAVNTLFSGLAFAGVIYAIFLQSEELALQRTELQLTRDELAKATAAQSEQAQALLESAKINALSSQLSMFTNLVINNRTLPNQEHRAMGDGMQNTYKKLEEILNKKT
jgi:hypothetical protein